MKGCRLCVIVGYPVAEMLLGAGGPAVTASELSFGISRFSLTDRCFLPPSSSPANEQHDNLPVLSERGRGQFPM